MFESPLSTQTIVFFLSCVLIIASISTRASGQDTSMIQSIERAIAQRTNDFRKSNQLRAVIPDEHLTQTAKKFAEFMACTGKYGHSANGMRRPNGLSRLDTTTVSYVKTSPIAQTAAK